MGRLRARKYILIGVGAYLAHISIGIAFQTYIKVKEARTWSVAGANQETIVTNTIPGVTVNAAKRKLPFKH